MTPKRRIIALIIWWCEGTKRRRSKKWKNTYYCPIEVINSDPRVVKIFTDFLREDLKVPNELLRGQIQIHEGDNKDEIEDYWVKEIGISKSQLNKTIIRDRGNKPNKNKGTFKLRLYNKVLFEKLEAMLLKELKNIKIGT